ncbi:hypothetical protein PILCRDRAFT_310265 [Piloderma croceum F 1598]|uniref:F-box domain-containing protein n=1 Tax=Piloderma croceum (strain F 1598) TaxID=765440 RepID=A0A0C3BJV9_PILCF|nr:hypothetical protein PILCRDRAFT_310265 [Piloderma croceum F 1598]
MHHSLQITEVLSHIFEYAFNDEQGSQTIYAIALACQAFRDPALMILWRHMTSLVPLIKCFPSDLWEVRGGHELGTLVFTRALLPSDFERVQPYARHIKYLNLEQDSDSDAHRRIRLSLIRPEVDPEIFRAIRLCQVTGPFLPNLLKLGITENQHDGLENVQLFIGTKLIAFFLQFSAINCDESTGAAVLTALKSKSPLLEELEISAGPQTSLTLSFALSDLLCGLKHLKSFSSPCIALTNAALGHLASLPALRLLGLGIQNEELFTPMPVVPTIQAFPALREITIWARHLANAVDMIGFICSSALEVAIFHIETPPSASLIHHLFLKLLENCSSASLTRIYGFQDDFTAEWNEGDNYVDIDNFRPLLSFSNLEYVWINACISFELVDDALIRDVAMAWPNLRQLDFGSMSCWGLSSRVTLAGLVPLCNNCPNLQVLGLTLDTSMPIRYPAVDPLRRGPYNDQMHTLQVGHSSIDRTHVGAVAAFLSRLYPNLMEIITWDRMGNGDEALEGSRDLWVEVAGLILHREGRGSAQQ